MSAPQVTDAMKDNQFSNATKAERSRAFEWLRAIALGDSPDWFNAGVALDCIVHPATARQAGANERVRYLFGQIALGASISRVDPPMTLVDWEEKLDAIAELADEGYDLLAAPKMADGASVSDSVETAVPDSAHAVSTSSDAAPPARQEAWQPVAGNVYDKMEKARLLWVKELGYTLGEPCPTVRELAGYARGYFDAAPPAGQPVALAIIKAGKS